MAELKPIIEQSMTQYAGAVLQSRALVDVRDCLKPSARQIFFCMDKYKYIAAKPFNKTMAAIGDAMKHFYIHGDSSCEGIIMRAGQSFAMRYPLIEVEGNGGTLLSSGNWAAPRYTSTRLSKLAAYLFNDMDKDTITDWRDNYADNEQYPGVLPSKGFYNIVNGTSGIGIGLASSIPQFNLREVNNALITLLQNPNCEFEEIYCAPDFATGAILLNEEQVKESLKNGTGFACKLRSVVSFDSGERCFVVTQIPYGVYTNTICQELEQIEQDEKNPGVERHNDLTGKDPLIKIYLSKNANPDRVLKYLYKNTSLQSFYGINMTMLENGRYPKVFTWKEALQAHIDHEIDVYKRGYEYDLRQINNRIHIISGLLICLASIDSVVKTIKESSSTADASIKLQKNFVLDEIQAKAVLDMKLSRLAHLEVQKLVKEKEELEGKAKQIEEILNNRELFNKQLINGWISVSKQFGDARRTQVLNVENDKDEPVEVKSIIINLTNKGNLCASQVSSLYTQRRGGVGNKFKLDKGEYVIQTVQATTTDTILFFGANGTFYHYNASSIPLEQKTNIEQFFTLQPYDHITTMISLNSKNEKKYVIFFTKQGYMKKSELSEYNVKRSGAMKAIELSGNDEICSIIFTDEEDVGILTEGGQFLICATSDVRPIGRVAKGVKSIKLNDDDCVCSAAVIPPSTKEIMSISNDGAAKRTSIIEFTKGTRYTKGSKIQKLKSKNNCIADFIPIIDENEILVVSTTSQIRLKVSDIPLQSKGTQGSQAINLTKGSYIIGLSKF